MNKEREGIVGYAHVFNRYFEFEGEEIDRLGLVLEHGIVSERKAKSLGIPYKKEMDVRIVGARNYDDIVFLFPLRDREIIPTWGNSVTVILSPNLPTVSLRDMMGLQEGNWGQGTRVFGGEFYAFGSASTSYFEKVVMPNGKRETIDNAKKLIRIEKPKRGDRRSVQI
ncbi:MAG TPA: hypothetical protein VM077_01450 [Candidatus Limnocylindrales bacterium]|nr:hypothetical protein [Candidatus Limnocylindrales bacterium]